MNLLDNKELGENQPLVFMTGGHKSVSKALSFFPSLSFLQAGCVKIEILSGLFFKFFDNLKKELRYSYIKTRCIGCWFSIFKLGPMN